MGYDAGVSEPKRDLPPSLGLWHLALQIPTERYDATFRFYRDVMGMGVDWQPDENAVYLSSGRDNLALHRVETVDRSHSPIDHLGFIVPSADAVEAWHARVQELGGSCGAEILNAPRTHRDGATSFYLFDPSGNKVQIVHIPNVPA